MDKALRDGLEKRAKKLGFDSAQAYIRVWAKAVVDGRKVDLDSDDWGEPPAHVVERWERELAEDDKLRARGKGKSYTDVSELMRDLTADEAD